MDKHMNYFTLKMYQELNMSSDELMDLIKEFQQISNIEWEQMDWGEFDKFVAEKHNYTLG